MTCALFKFSLDVNALFSNFYLYVRIVRLKKRTKNYINIYNGFTIKQLQIQLRNFISVHLLGIAFVHLAINRSKHSPRCYVIKSVIGRL